MMNRVPYPRGPFQEIIEFFGSVHDESCALSGISDRDEEIRYQGRRACGYLESIAHWTLSRAPARPKGRANSRGDSAWALRAPGEARRHWDLQLSSLIEMLSKLPGWVVDDDSSVREEVAEWRGLTPAELWRLAHHCSRDAIWAARVSGNPQRILDLVDPLPDDAVVALARLRQASGWSRDAR
jgi:hypothetical protein